MSLEPNGLIAAMEAALAEEWKRTKNMDLPAAGSEDRRLILAAAAIGLLRYLKNNQKEVLNSFTAQEEPGGNDRRFTVVDADLNITGV
jgi:hypothetical protein